jgi:predicted RNase H-like HicB family nuclease
VKIYPAVIERDPQTGLFVRFVPGFPGAHSQGATRDELSRNLEEAIAMLSEDGDPQLKSEFVGIQNIAVGAAASLCQAGELPELHEIKRQGGRLGREAGEAMVHIEVLRLS